MNKEKTAYKALDMQALAHKNGKIVSSKEALKDVKPIIWDIDILNGDNKVTVKSSKAKTRPTIEELFADYKGETKCEEYDWGKPVGKEIIPYK